MANIFDHPERYRKHILESKIFDTAKIPLEGKSIICLFLTRFCTVGCPFCFFRSAPAWRKNSIEDQLSDYGLDRFIEFANNANLGYLLVSGGGEPLNKKKHILKLIERVDADIIVLATSGSWAVNYLGAVKYLQDIKEAISNRSKKLKVVVRVSVSEGHSIKLGLKPIIHLLKIFDVHYQSDDALILQIKTFEDDSSLSRLFKELPELEISSDIEKRTSDNELLIKIIPEKFSVKMKSGYKVLVGKSKIFYSSLKPNLQDYKVMREAINIYERDLAESEGNNSAIVENANGTKGLDWSVSFNGNVCVWQNQVRDNDMNIYADSYDKVFRSVISDPVTYSLIDKGNLYRDKIIAEISPKTVLKTKAIGLRDSAGAVIFYDKRNILYYTIRVLQEYLAEGKFTELSYEKWPEDIKNMVSMTKEELIECYKRSSYNIVEQEKQKKFNEQEWYDFLELIKLSHFDLTEIEIKHALDYYNLFAQNKLMNLSEIEDQKGDVYRRLTERYNYIKRFPMMPVDWENESNGEGYACNV